jgi:N-carbamoylputrescine amidase
MPNLIVAAVQIACGEDIDANVAKIESHMREAARRGAGLVVLQELFEGPYFCVDIDVKHNARAKAFAGHATVARLARLAKELGVVLPVSFFEADGNTRCNSLAMIDANGAVLGLYRKSHIPDNPGYSENSILPMAIRASGSLRLPLAK